MCDIVVPKASRTRAINKTIDNTVSRIVVNEHYIKSKVDFNSRIKNNYPTFFVSGRGDVRENSFYTYRYEVKTKKYGTVTITPASAYSSNYTIAYTDSGAEKSLMRILLHYRLLLIAQPHRQWMLGCGSAKSETNEDIELDVKKEKATPMHSLFLLAYSSEMQVNTNTRPRRFVCHNAQNGANLRIPHSLHDNVNHIPDMIIIKCDLAF